MCRQGGNFEEYYIKADKALYYVKQNGKNNYRFYEELEEQQTDAQARKNDLECNRRSIAGERKLYRSMTNA